MTTSEDLGRAVLEAVEELLVTFPTAEVAGEAWRNVGEVVVCEDDAEMAAVADAYAPEHVEVQTHDPDWFLDRLRNYGSLFLGAQSTVAYGDKAIGVNHVLPTSRAARYTGGLWVGKFLKTVTYRRVTEEGTRRVAPATAGICEAEHMLGHALTATARARRPGPPRHEDGRRLPRARRRRIAALEQQRDATYVALVELLAAWQPAKG